MAQTSGSAEIKNGIVCRFWDIFIFSFATGGHFEDIYVRHLWTLGQKSIIILLIYHEGEWDMAYIP